MLAAKTRWMQSASSIDDVQEWQKQAGVSALVAKLCLARGWTDIAKVKEMLKMEEQSFHDPFLLQGMPEAVERIQLAIERNEKIRIYGDYDCDGVSSTTIMVLILKELGANFDFYIPNRFSEGYGLNIKAMDAAKESQIDLVITVDTGISAWVEIDYAISIGLDVIVTDHHEPPPRLPDCISVINPKLPTCTYPYKYLAGAGVALKLGQALLGRLPDHLLDIACIGTIADLVPLTGENRLIAYHGLKRLNHTRHLGIEVLLENAGLLDEVVNEEHVGFTIAPRINASGRLDKADYAVQLFLTEDREEATGLVDQLNEHNQQRQKLVEKMTKEAITWVEEHYPEQKPKVLVIAKEDWNIGVVGIVASKMVEKYYLPTLILSIDQEKGVAKGSARSITGFDMYQALRTCDDLLPHYGGHPMAAGLSLEVSNLEHLRMRLDQCGEQWLTEEDLIPVTRVDVLCQLEDVTLEGIEELSQLAPFGVENPRPMICLEQMEIKEMKKVGANKNHLKCQFRQSEAVLDGIGFFLGDRADKISPGAKLDLIGQVDINVWNGKKKPQIMIKDMRVPHQQIFDWRGARQLEQQFVTICDEEEKLALIQFRTETVIPTHIRELVTVITLDTEVQALEQKTEHMLQKFSTIVLWDLPRSMEQFEKVCELIAHGKNIYVVFDHQQDHYFSMLPTREHFKWFYAFLNQRKSFDRPRHGQQLAKHKGWTLESIDFMIEVFLELEFAKMEKGLIVLHDQPNKKSLQESIAYKQKQLDIQVEQELLYSSYQVLVELIHRNQSRVEQKKEAVSNGF